MVQKVVPVPMAAGEPALRRQRLDRSLNGILLVIGIQFFFGIWLNLYGAFPSNSSLPGAVTYGSDPVLALHVVLGVLLFLGSIAVLVQTFRDPWRPLRWFGLAGFVGILLADAGGSQFVYSSYSNPAASFLMAVGFGVALTAYYEGLVRLRTYPVVPPMSSAGASPPSAASP